MPRPPVPDGLEARLLAAVPAGMPVARRRRAVRFVAVVAVAATLLLAVLARPRRDGENLDPGPRPVEHARQAPPRPPDHFAGIAGWRGARRALDGAEVPPFTWPLQGTSSLSLSTPIPPDLLD